MVNGRRNHPDVVRATRATIARAGIPGTSRALEKALPDLPREAGRDLLRLVREMVAATEAAKRRLPWRR